MPDYKLANSLAAEALKLWGAGDLETAADPYARAIAAPEGGEAGMASFHGAFAGVLQQLGHHGEALEQFQKALTAEVAQGEAETSISVNVAHEFLADHLTNQGEPAKALEVLAPAIRA